MNSTTTQSTVRRAEDRGQANHGWLQARFTFSFANYFDPDQMGFRSLRVMNNDTIQPGGGFPTHAHDSAEIFTYVISGQLEHKDSMGNGAVIEPGNLQYMSAGAGVRHSEFNPSQEHPTELYQIWMLPKESGGEPRYAEKPLGDLAQPNALTLLFSGDGREGSTEIRQDAEFSFGRIDAGHTLSVPANAPQPHAWLQVVRGKVAALGHSLKTGDGLAIEHAPEGFAIKGEENSEFFLFRLN